MDLARMIDHYITTSEDEYYEDIYYEDSEGTFEDEECDFTIPEVVEK